MRFVSVRDFYLLIGGIMLTAARRSEPDPAYGSVYRQCNDRYERRYYDDISGIHVLIPFELAYANRGVLLNSAISGV